MTAIETYYLGPTLRRGSRIVAVALGTRRRIMLPVSPEWDDRMMHRVAAESLAYQREWVGTWAEGDGHKGRRVWVQISRFNIATALIRIDAPMFYVAPVNEA